ncbi:glucose-1-phosphate thymidylyltransferase [Candidatus Micrarchaeota archaeon]|nr:glucose-1-phosphate thymidylyltransferase [Candidatus Micrarchaeota archaeon]
MVPRQPELVCHMQKLLIGVRTYQVENNAEQCEEQLADIRAAFPQATVLLLICGLPPGPRMAAHADAVIHYSDRPLGLGIPTRKILEYAKQNGFSHAIVLDGGRQHQATEIAEAYRRNLGKADAVIPERSRRFLFTRGQLDGTTMEDLMNGFLRIRTGHTLADPVPGAYILYDTARLPLTTFTPENSWAGDSLLVEELLQSKAKIATPPVTVRSGTYAISSTQLVFNAVDALEKQYGMSLEKVTQAVRQAPQDFLYQGNLGFIDAILDARRAHGYRQAIGGMKALILAGGKGTRLRPFTNTIQKQVFPIANKPILHFIMEKIAKSGISEVGVIVGPNQDQIRNCLHDGSDWNVHVTYIEQDAPSGLAHAVLTAEKFLAQSPFLMYLGDNLLRDDLTDFLIDFIHSDVSASIMLTEVKEPEKFGIAELDGQGRIIRLHEKPKEPHGNLGIIGVYAFRPDVFQAIRAIRPSARGELEITDAIQKLLEMRKPVGHRLIRDWWEDTGNADSILKANALILDEMPAQTLDSIKVEPGCIIKGRVQIGQGTVIRNNSTIIGPASIGEHCTIESSFVGPYTTLGNRNQLHDAHIEYGLTMEGVRLESVGPMRFSIIGKNSQVKGQSPKPEEHVLMLGDDTQTRI